MRVDGLKSGRVIAAATLVAAAMVAISWTDRTDRTLGTSRGSARLVSIEQYSESEELCTSEPAIAESETTPDVLGMLEALRPQPLYAASQAGSGETVEITRPPVRNIRDTDPVYTAVAVDNFSNEVYLQDSNTWSLHVFNRSDNTPPAAARTEPKRVLGGEKTGIQFNSSVYVDPSGDVFTVENDVGGGMGVFPRGAAGDTAPQRRLNVTHRAYAIVVDEDAQELYVSGQAPSQVAVYRKFATGEEKPVRLLKGPRTQLADAHGIAIDRKRKLLFVNNWGATSFGVHGNRPYGVYGDHDPESNLGAGGVFNEPSITVYSLDANGDVPPLRKIQGPKTQLNWPGIMSFNDETGELYVANTVDQSVVVFRATDEGDAPPVRMLKGSKTGLSHPMGLSIDAKNQGLWISNIGNASATVYPLMAQGDVPPLRTIRSAPRGKRSLRFGKAMAIAYDSKRDEILVPN